MVITRLNSIQISDITVENAKSAQYYRKERVVNHLIFLIKSRPRYIIRVLNRYTDRDYDKLELLYMVHTNVDRYIVFARRRGHGHTAVVLL